MTERYEKLQEIHMDDKTSNTRILKYDGITYGDVTDDPIEQPVHTSKQVRNCIWEKIKSDLAQQVDDAIANGLS